VKVLYSGESSPPGSPELSPPPIQENAIQEVALQSVSEQKVETVGMLILWDASNCGKTLGNLNEKYKISQGEN